MTTTRVPFNDLGRMYRRHRDAIDAAVARVLASGWYILGAELEAFERAFAAYCGVRQAVGVGSGTEAIHLALRAAGVAEGTAVITAPNTAVPTVCGIVEAGATPIFADIDPRTYTLDPESIRETIRRHRSGPPIRAIVPVHLYGQIAEMGPIGAIAREEGLVIVGDAAQAHGAEYDGHRVDRFTNLACYSFYPTKNLGALGDAGMVVTHDESAAERLRMLRNYGEESKYRARTRGINSRLDELQAAILMARLPHLDDDNATRRRLAELYNELLAGTPLVLPFEAGTLRHCYHLYVVRHPDRDAIRRHLDARGISTQVHYPTPIYLQPAFADLGLGPGACPEAEHAAREILSLPMHPDLTEDEVRATCSALVDFFNG